MAAVRAADDAARAPALGSKRPGGHRRDAAGGGPDGGLSAARRPRARPGLHDVGRRLARRLVRERLPEGLDRLDRRRRRLGRAAYSPGTAYNLLHHALGELDGIVGAWGQVIGGMGAISEAIAASSPRRRRRDPHRRRGRQSIDVRGGSAIGVTLADGELRAPIVASGAHPKTTVLDLAGAANFPDEVSRGHAPPTGRAARR